ncbi:hypothetical protein E2P63_05330 [Candidatus Bathyarchaeota archaeon]|nr:hypothetical protein E2P63_05330 [Candidatus Bathyarchaeota archaeon]
MGQNDLTHFGVPGMKWGVRRSRRSGGTTSGGKRRTAKQHFKDSVNQKYGGSAKGLKRLAKAATRNTQRIQSALRKSKLRKLNDILTDQDAKHADAVNLMNHILVAGALATVTYKALKEFA